MQKPSPRAVFPIEKGVELLDPTGKRDPQLERLEVGDSVLITDRAPTTVRNMVIRVGRRLGKKYVTRRVIDASGKWIGVRIHRTE